MQAYDERVLKRTHTCGQLRAEDVGSRVRLCGWVRSYRDHGGVVFIDLRDRDGITQVVYDLPDSKDAEAVAMYDQARALRKQIASHRSAHVAEADEPEAHCGHSLLPPRQHIRRST